MRHGLRLVIEIAQADRHTRLSRPPDQNLDAIGAWPAESTPDRTPPSI